MPNLNVYLVEGFAPERKTALLKRMTDAIVTTIGAPREAVRIFLIELARAHVCVGGVTLLEADLPGGPTVHALLVAGRSEAQKEALIGGLTRAIEETLDVPAEPVRIMILDIANTDFGMQGVTARSLGR
jgi:4-oxalocrotonate tautomerase